MRAASAMPRPMDSPWPSAPVQASTPGTTVSGWPPRNEVEVAEAVELLEREEAPIGQHGVERQAAMALAQDEAVALAPPRLGRIMAQEVVVEDANDLDQGKRRPDMPSPAILDGTKDEAPQVPATLVQRRLLNQIEVGRVLQRSLMLHASGLLSNRQCCNFQISTGAHGLGVGFWTRRYRENRRNTRRLQSPLCQQMSRRCFPLFASCSIRPRLRSRAVP